MATYGELADVASLLSGMDWGFDAPHGREPIHDLHSYPARFIPQIPRQLIRLLHPGGRVPVLDPFFGSGTTIVEATLAGLPAAGVDLNPLATLIASVKTTPLRSSLIEAAQRVVAQARRVDVPIPSIPRLDHWFMPHVQQNLANLTYQIELIMNESERQALMVALSRIIIRVSNQESDTRYAAIVKNIESDQVNTMFLDSAAFIEGALTATYGGFFPPTPACRILNLDILKTTVEDIGTGYGLVITSPPYPNAYEYWLYHKYRMYWLGMDPLHVRANEIGARPNYFKSKPHDAGQFFTVMESCCELLSKVMNPGSFACFLIGRSIIRGEVVDNADAIVRAAQSNGFTHVVSLPRNIPTTRKAFNPSHTSLGPNRETLVVVRSGG